ncbi:MAG: PEP/pyruvate-binding domain-containing protein [Phycisphaerae bacterium]
MHESPSDNLFHRFDRKFFDSDQDFTLIGSGALGGKAQGLAFIKGVLERDLPADTFSGIEVGVPRLTVITTDHFDRFMQRNDLRERAFSDAPDDRIAHAFQSAELPVEIVGDLRGLIEKVHTPLAIRSSSLLEDALHHPFAGVYATKMIPNNQLDATTRFRKLVEAIKFVYASTFFKGAKSYMKAIGHGLENEKMAVIIQEVVGRRYGDRFYPTLSGVARSYNFYPTGRARPEHGVVNLALGLGKTIVDGGVSWTYSPAFPAVAPPYGSIGELLKQTQTVFWTVNMGKPPSYDPIHETEYLVRASLENAEADGTLRYVASTYIAASDRLNMGIGSPGPRAITFAPILDLPDIPLNNLAKTLLRISEQAAEAKVEIEFAMTLDPEQGLPARFGFLQVRPMMVSDEFVEVSAEEMAAENVLAASESVLGNGVINTLEDVVYVRPEEFEAKHTPEIAAEIEAMNVELVKAERPYLLIGFGRWGSSDPWLGIPVTWPQVSGAKVIVEATTPEMNVDPSQGAHFFHNITSLRVSYFSVHHAGEWEIDWDWLGEQQRVAETRFVKHVRLPAPLRIKVDGRSSRGVILRATP